jgi:FeS assembly SUF system regulator
LDRAAKEGRKSMFRMSRLTDYGIVILAQMAGGPEGEPHTARGLAEATHLPLPTVTKLLKQLGKSGLLASIRGTKGGYRLTRSPRQVSMAEVIAALEGPISLTECNGALPSECIHEAGCRVRPSWAVINRAIRGALERVTLAEMVTPPVALRPHLTPLSLPSAARPDAEGPGASIASMRLTPR